MKIQLLAIFFLTTSFFVNAQIQLEETTVDTTTIISGLDIPWEIQWGPDDMLWITERFGRISRIDPETGDQDIILDISSIVSTGGESGLLGLVLHPDFDTNPYVYTVYTYMNGSNKLERIVRYEYNGTQLEDEFILLDNIQGNITHIGCRLLITPDYKLLITTGDAQNQPSAQNIDHLSGKILRLNLDGTIPEDNPWPGNPAYSFGHRNAQGLYLGSNGILYSSEHGPATDDELNIIEPGRNYGWPNVHGFCDLPNEITFCEANNVFEPMVAWTPTIATSDIVLYEHPSIPEFTNRILLTSLKNKRLYVMELDESGTSVVSEDQYFFNTWGRLRDICVGPDGAIYLATNGPDWGNSQPFTHRIIKVWNQDYITSNNESQLHEKLVHIFPNPVKEQLNISIDPKLIGEELSIVSVTGQLVHQQIMDTIFVTIPTVSFKNGIYTVMIGNQKNKQSQEKIIILKN